MRTEVSPRFLDSPRVSVLMPAYNAAATIGQAVASALAQTVEEIEVIVVDDGSVLPAAEALRCVRDERVRVIQAFRNRGAGAARNTALAEARAPMVAQLDADDLWKETHLEGLLPAMADPQVGLAYANVEVVGHPGGLDRWIAERRPGDGLPVWITDCRLHPVNDMAMLYRINPIPSPAVVMRTAAARAVGGYPEWLSVGEDYLLYIRLRRAGWRFAYVDRRSAIYRWPEPGRGATFNARRNARQEAKLFTVLALSSPRNAVIRRRLVNELADVVAAHVPGVLPAWRLIGRIERHRHRRVTGGRPEDRRDGQYE